MNYGPRDLASVSPAYWADRMGLKLQVGPFSLKGHEYQQEPMDSHQRRRCFIKATQGGFSEMEVNGSLHGMIHKRYPLGVLYMFPTGDDVTEFSKSRFNPLINDNPLLIGKYVQSTDTASLKRIHDAHLFLRGARLSQKVAGDQDESSKLRSISVDKLVFDEVDLMDQMMVAKARGRLGASAIKEEIYISNPTIPDFGIDKIFQKSDRRHWFRRCGCGTWTCAELSFPSCVKIRNDGMGYIGCDKCGEEVPISPGEWVPERRENSDYMHGYQWSQLTSCTNDPAEILRDIENPPEDNLGDVYRLRLGIPYIADEDRLTQAQVFACCGQEPPRTYHGGPCAMGVDVGKIKHVIIGARIGDDQYQIYRAIKLSDWNDIHDIAKKFNVKSAVIDARPYEDAAKAFQTAEPYKIFLCEYDEYQSINPMFNNKTGMVKVNRTAVFDKTHRMIVTPGMLTIPRVCDETKELARQLCNTAKVLETNKRTQQSVYRYKKLGDEHFRNALNYLSLACSGGRIVQVGSNVIKQTKAVNNYRVA